MRYAGSLKNILKKKKEKKEKKKRRSVTASPVFFEQPLFTEEVTETSSQTFPGNNTVTIHRQLDGQLTCGMRCLQNMYGKHIVSREEMDLQSKKLEINSHGIEMYNPDANVNIKHKNAVCTCSQNIVANIISCIVTSLLNIYTVIAQFTEQ